jgi:hypothetical protein
MISGSEYVDRWHKYASQFHSDVNVSANKSEFSNEYLFRWIHLALQQSLQRERNLALREGSPQHWDQVVEVLCQVDTDTLSQGWSTCYDVAPLWFEVWKVSSQFHNFNYPSDTSTFQIRHKDVSDAGIVYEIRLEQLQLDRLLPEDHQNHTVAVLGQHSNGMDYTYGHSQNINAFDEYILGLKYFQQHNPTLPVLICGTRGNRLAVFTYDYCEEDFEERPLHAGRVKDRDFDNYWYRGYYCIQYPDDV